VFAEDVGAVADEVEGVTEDRDADDATEVGQSIADVCRRCRGQPDAEQINVGLSACPVATDPYRYSALLA
jgi:hypothetical protein